jgi:hypothetical protein
MNILPANICVLPTSGQNRARYEAPESRDKDVDELKGFDGVDLSGYFKGELLQGRTKGLLLSLRHLFKQVYVRSGFAALKCGKAGRIRQSATEINQAWHIPFVLPSPGIVMMGDDRFEIGRQLPILH